jgi:hypothetical protein
MLHGLLQPFPFRSFELSFSSALARVGGVLQDSHICSFFFCRRSCYLGLLARFHLALHVSLQPLYLRGALFGESLSKRFALLRQLYIAHATGEKGGFFRSA